jgi:hypothetical protein
MQIDEPDTPLESGTDNVTPESDTAEDLTTYWDPDDDQDTPEDVPEAATDEGTEESEPTEEAEDLAPEEPAQISLPDGTKVTLDEAVKGYLRQSDYTRKATELATTRKALEADLQTVEGITQTFIDHLTKMVPPEPDMAMALRDPNGYVKAKAQYDAAMAQIKQLIDIGKQPKQIGEKLNKADQQAKIAAENAALAEKFPMAATPEGRQKFFASAAEAAQQAGFSMDDLQGVSDHRLFVLAHWANEGLKAAKARETAKAKVANVPPAAPRKPGQPAQANRNADAMRKLAQSGSIRDALKVDWE